MIDKGLVTKVHGGAAVVELESAGHCDQCGARIVCAPAGDGRRLVRAQNPLQAQCGQQVAVTQTRDLLLKLSLMQYGLPLLGFLAGIFAAYYFQASLPQLADELVWFFAGMAGLLLCGLITQQWAGKTARRSSFFFVISEIYQGT